MSSEPGQSGRRPYRKRRRADQEQATRERITRAAVKLHGSVGPARTTVSGVAKEAGVQRATVYRHFPDEEALFAACSAHWAASNPPPDFEAWKAIRDPSERLARGLDELYAYWRETEGMFEKTSRDVHLVAAMAGPWEAMRAILGMAADNLVSGRTERGNARKRVRAAAGHAVQFATWQSLVRGQGLASEEAAALMATFVESAGEAG
jgi:AcrR family transcriptional regulator